MIRRFREETSVPNRNLAPASRAHALVTTLIIALAASPVAGQEPPSGVGASAPPAFTATVVKVAPQYQRLSLGVNKSVMIELSLPASRMQAVSDEVADVQAVSPRQALVTGRTVGTTQVIVFSEDGQKQVFDVSVGLELDELNEAIGKVDPQARVEAVPARDTIILTGVVSDAETAERIGELAQVFSPKVSNNIRVSGEQQVLLRCTIAEVSKSSLRALGVNGFLAGNAFRDAFVINQLDNINPISIGAAGGVNVRGDVPFVTPTTGIPVAQATTLSLGFPRVQMQVFIKALRENGLLRVMAEPNLVAISGETASFLAGGEFPIPVPQGGSASGAITVEFREFGVKMNFTPVVKTGQRIRLRVAPEVSETDFSTAIQLQGFVVPGLTSRQAETTVELGNGQTLAIAGLLNDQIRGIARTVPGLGDLPVLGALFRSVEYRDNLTELVIFITPEIIAPINPDQVPPAPGELITAPNDWQLYGLGLLEGDPAEPEINPDDALQTNPPRRMARPSPANDDRLSLRGPWGLAEEQETK